MNTQTKKYFLLTAVLVVLTFLPFIGLSDFNTKGEPREAVVAHSMIATDNWILPQNNGGDIAYKPPMFHWAIAVASTIAGEVNEFTSRLPSAVALIVMVLALYLFYVGRRHHLYKLRGAPRRRQLSCRHGADALHRTRPPAIV